MDDGKMFDLLRRHAEAWNAHDADALLELMTDDCIYDTSAGVEAHGTRHMSHEDLKPAFEATWTTFADAAWDEAEHFVAGDRGFSSWVFRGTRPDGVRVEVKGLDVLHVRDGKICWKDTYRKSVATS